MEINKRPLVMGIDPGLKGGISLLDFSQPKTPQLLTVKDLPTLIDERGKTRLDPLSLSLLIDIYSEHTRFCMVEEVGVMGGHEGVVSMFNFGYSSGIISGILHSCLIPTFFVKPAVWKGVLGLSRDKNESRMKVMELFPSHSHLFKRKKDDGRAESVLLGWFGGTRLFR